MNVLIVDDIKLIGKSLKEGLGNLMPNSNICFFHYNVEICESENISMISEKVKHNEINILLLDRGYSKIYEDSEDEFVYSSISEADRNLRVRGEDLLCNNNGLLERLSNLDIKLSSILLYTYDIGDININNKIQNIKVDVQSKLSQLNFDNILFEVFETSTVFNKPTNSRIYPDSFYFNTKYKDSFIDYGKKKRNIGTKLAYKEYGQLMSHIIVDLIRQKGNNNIYDFSNPGNREFDIFLRSVSKIQLSDIEERLEYYVDKSGNPATKQADHAFTAIKLRPSTVSVIFDFQGTEKYYIDIPYKEYYDSLNDDIPEDLINFFKTKTGEYRKREFVYYSYNYLSDLSVYQLYCIKVSEGLSQELELAKKWLPFLHCGLFHLNQPILWETPTIIENSSYDGEKIGLFFFIDTIEIDEFKGHINFTFYEESDRKFCKGDIENSANLILDNISPILKSKATDVLIPKLKELLLFEATRAAISQVMARNSSHNIGAHVMNKLIGEFDYDKLFRYTYDSTKLSELYKVTIVKWNKEREKLGKANLTPEEEKQKILLDQISIFNNYVKCRMDYLADISFGTPLMQTNKYVYGELFTEFDKVRLLLEHISGLDNFQFKIEFKRNGKAFEKDEKGNILNDLLVAIPNDILGTQAFYNILENIIRNTAKHSNKETLVDEKPVVFTVNFIDDIEESEEHKHAVNRDEINNILTEFIAVEVYDNIPVVGPERALTPEEKKEYYDKMKKRDKDKFPSKIDALVFNQNSKLNDDILSKENKIRSYSLGLVEMDASAAYLRKRPVEYINHKSYDIQYDEWWSRDTEVNEGNQEKRGTNCRHFLKAFKKTVEIEKEENGIKKADIQNYLGYRFFLHRPAVVLVVTNELENDKEKRYKLQKEGIWVITPQKFEQELKLKQGKVYPHEFVMHTDLKGYKTQIINNNKEEEVELLKYFKTSLPIRFLEVTKDQLNDLFDKQESTAEIQCDDKIITIKKKILDTWEEFCWQEWEKLLKAKYRYSQYGTTGLPKVNNKIALITDHLKPKEGKSIETTWTSLKEDNNAYYIEPTSTKAQSYLPQFSKVLNNHYRNNSLADINKPLDNYLTELKNNYVVNKIKVAESILTQITVIDERIQEANKQIPTGIVQHEIYHWMRIYEPEKGIINLSSNTIDDTLKNKIETFIQEKSKESDFLLIHYSILERIHHSKTGKEKLKAINDDLLRYAGIINVVVTSGRGVPDKLPSEVRFINLSSVINAFNDVRGKFLINYLLNSSRKSNHV
ncbi:MAG: hypothetical protein JST37_14490 [Bacteroidetes bacterium]|nr:hypothetical protein [Bacteroidota bacterium]